MKKLVSSAVAASIALVLVALPTVAGAASYPNDPYLSRQWGLTRMHSVASWKVSKGKGVTIAILDTGVSPHEDLNAKIVKGGYDFVDNDADPADAHFHGTYVSGIAAAVTNNRRGIAGQAPEAKILPVRVLNANGEGTGDQIAEGIMYAADRGAKVINLSLGGLLPIGGPEDAAVSYAFAKGATVVVAAGNSSLPFCETPSFNPMAICVGASDSLDRIASFSNHAVRLDVVAPGVDIWSTARFGNYTALAGTSAAAPFVAGLAAQLMSMGANNVMAGAIIRQTSKDLGIPGYDTTYGFGRVDALAAVTLCAQIC